MERIRSEIDAGELLIRDLKPLRVTSLVEFAAIVVKDIDRVEQSGSLTKIRLRSGHEIELPDLDPANLIRLVEALASC